MEKTLLIASDLEGVWIPEVWIEIAQKLNIQQLLITTRDEPNYHKLMTKRIKILQENNITLQTIQNIITQMKPLLGAKETLATIRKKYQIILLSDTFYEFVAPFMAKLDQPTLFCHNLETDSKGIITNYKLRMEDGKRQTVIKLKQLNFRTLAIGDSYNDTKMLLEADCGILFRPPPNVIDEFPQLPVVTDYQMLLNMIDQFA